MPRTHYSALSTRYASGQAVVELAFMLPILALLLLGLIDLGRVFYTYVGLTNAAREGARYCALNPGDTAGTQARVAGELDGWVAPDLSGTLCENPSIGQPVTVSVAASFVPSTPLIGNITGGAITVRVPATMVVWK